MIIRELQKKDFESVKEIFNLYWTDPEFIKELSDTIDSFAEKRESSKSFFFVAEEGNEILGVVAYKKIPDYLKEFAKTENPVELYIITSKNIRQGVGLKLKTKLVDEARKSGYGEILLFSPYSHQQSWGFHDTLGFERVSEVTPPEDNIGMVWRKVL